VIIDHGRRSYSVYGMLDRIFVKLNDFVKSRQIIGQVAYHPIQKDYLFYFETRYRGKAVNPMQWFKKSTWTN
jgi:septal ring factor EnvC (AmiA/AmiB activator)